MNIEKSMEDIMKINRFKEESKYEYNIRLFHSAVSFWIDHVIYFKSEPLNKFKIINCINEKCRYLYYILNIPKNWLPEDELNKFIDFFIDKKIDIKHLSINKEGFYDIHPINLLYNNKLFCKENKGNTSVRSGMVYLYDYNELDTKRECFDLEKDIYMRNKKIENIMKKDLPLEWKVNTSIGIKKIFIPNKTGIFEKSWNKFSLSNSLKNNRYLTIGCDGNYYIYEKQDNKQKFYKLNEYYVLEKEIYRLMYYIYSKSKFYNSYIGEVDRSVDNFNIHLENKLPKLENIILNNLSWPVDRYNSRSYFVTTLEGGEVIDNMLKNLR